MLDERLESKVHYRTNGMDKVRDPRIDGAGDRGCRQGLSFCFGLQFDVAVG